MIRKMIAFDWLTMKRGALASFFIVPISAFIMGSFHPFYMIPLCVFFCFGLTPFEIEEKGNMHYVYLSMPIRRRDVVTGRFVLSLILFLCGLVMGRIFISVIGLIATHVPLLIHIVQPSISFNAYLAIVAFSYLLFALLSLMTLPLIFAVGYSKGKYAVLYGGYIPLMFVLTLFGAWDWSATQWTGRGRTVSPILHAMQFASENLVLAGIGLFIISTAILLISYRLSLRAYLKRDF